MLFVDVVVIVVMIIAIVVAKFKDPFMISIGFYVYFKNWLVA